MNDYDPILTLTKPDNNYHLSVNVALGPLEAISLCSFDPSSPVRTYVYDVVDSSLQVSTDSHIIIGDSDPLTELDINGAHSVEVVINAPVGPPTRTATRAYSTPDKK